MKKISKVDLNKLCPHGIKIKDCHYHRSELEDKIRQRETKENLEKRKHHYLTNKKS